MIKKYQNAGPLPDFDTFIRSLSDPSKQVKGANTNSNHTVAVAKRQAKQAVQIKTQTDKTNKRIADDHAYRAVQERDRRRRNQQNNVSSEVTPEESDHYAATHGEIKADNWRERALSQYGLANAMGQFTNISDKWRATPSFANFVGKDVPLSMATVGPAVAAPQTALFGLGTSLAGSYVGGEIGKHLGDETAGKIIGSFAGPIGVSAFNRATRPLLQKSFANAFGDAYGYTGHLPKIIDTGKMYLKSFAGKGPKSYPKTEISLDGENFIVNMDKGNKGFIISDNPSDVARAQAVAKYAGASETETPLYAKNVNGTYQYNQENNPYPFMTLINDHNRFQFPGLRYAKRKGYAVAPDFLGNNGGNVGIKYQGQFTRNGELYDRFMMRDVWDLQPGQSIANNIAAKLMYTKTPIPKKIAIPLGKVIQKVGKSKMVNREVGRIVGAKPFTLEHPFAVKASVVDNIYSKPVELRIGNNSLNMHTNTNVPGAQFSTPYEIGLDMPFNFNYGQRNVVYPLYNAEYHKNRAKSIIAQ